MDPEKAALAAHYEQRPQSISRPKTTKTSRLALLAASAFCAYTIATVGIPSIIECLKKHKHHHHHHPDPALQCPQVGPLFPANQTDALKYMDTIFDEPAFRDLSIDRLSGAVKIPSISYDDLGPIGEDKRWEVMFDFAEYLKDTYPKTHEELKLETVNTHGLLYTWEGSDSSLKPTLLMAHYDVVPVPDATVDAWTHPPFSGHFDGKYVWGRGSSDCKNQLTAIMASVEALLVAGFKPTRTVLLSFGFDEEVSGPQGAGHLAPFITERYGKDSVAVIVDEGSTFSSVWGQIFALPGVGEKGYTDVHVTVRMPGGHSSIPPPHTGIGVMSELITMIEGNPYPTRLDRSNNPFYGLLQCGNAYAPDFPKSLSKIIDDKPGHCTDKLALEAAEIGGPPVKYLMQTSIAVDIINGGAKVNALPERVTATVNHRVNVGEHPSQVHDKVTKLAHSVAKKYNLTLHAFDDVEAPSSISLYASSDHTLEPAPVTPTSGAVWEVLSGTTKGLYPDVVMAPGIMTGNTDTKFYWDLTRNIFRFGPGWVAGEEGLGNIHTVDEHQSVAAHIQAIKWFSLFIRNMDQAEL